MTTTLARIEAWGPDFQDIIGTPLISPTPIWIDAWETPTLLHTEPTIRNELAELQMIGVGTVPLALRLTADPDTVSIIGVGMSGSAPVFSVVFQSGADATVVIPSPVGRRLLSGIYGGVDVFSFWRDPEGLQLVTPQLPSRTARVRNEPTSLELEARSKPRAVEALRAMNDLMTWLHRSREEVAHLSHFSLRSSHNWSSGLRGPRPKTVRRLYETHAFVDSLIRSVGQRKAVAWLEQLDDSGTPRLNALEREDGLPTLIREASELLFAERRRSEPIRPENWDEGLDDLDEPEDLLLPSPVTEKPRLARRISSPPGTPR